MIYLLNLTTIFIRATQYSLIFKFILDCKEQNEFWHDTGQIAEWLKGIADITKMI